MIQDEFDFRGNSRPAFTRQDFEIYRKEWRKAFAALGGCDRAGWMQDLCLYFDLQWDHRTGDVGPTRYFIAPLIIHPPFDCREIFAPESWNIHKVLRALESFAGFYLHGPTPCLSRRMMFRTQDISVKGIKAAIKAHKKFQYADRTARCGRLLYASS